MHNKVEGFDGYLIAISLRDKDLKSKPVSWNSDVHSSPALGNGMDLSFQALPSQGDIPDQYRNVCNNNKVRKRHHPRDFSEMALTFLPQQTKDLLAKSSSLGSVCVR